MKQKWKKYLKRILIVLGMIISLAVLLFLVFIYKISNSPFMDDGPFVGKKRTDCELSNPDSLLVLPDGTKLEIYLPERGNESPTVRHINSGGLVSWCIYADGYENTSVRSIEFYSVQPYSYDEYLIKGSVRWTFGHERTLWYLKSDGDLINYWYSW